MAVDNRYDQIVVLNTDDEAFDFAVDGQEYSVGAGEARAFPRFIANYFVKHFVDHLINKLNDPKITTNNSQYRQKFAEQIVLDEKPIASPRTKTRAERDLEMVEKMNTSTDLDAILKKRKAKLKEEEGEEGVDAKGRPLADAPAVDNSTPLVAPPAPNLETVVPAKKVTPQVEEFAGLKPKAQDVEVEGAGKVVPTLTNEDGAAKLPGEMTDGDQKKVVWPERADLYAYAKNELKLDIDDPKSRKVWDKMKIDDLIKEFNYPMDGEE